MKIILIDVMSLDGKLTKWDTTQVSDWSSPEDLIHFTKTREANTLLIMGSGTYDAVKPHPEKERLRIVVTNHPEKYSDFAVPGQIEFTSETPTALVKRLEQVGYTQALLVGGEKIATAFFESNLIQELWITIEPRVFGAGKPFVSKKMDISLQLIEMKKVNNQGTLVVKYTVL